MKKHNIVIFKPFTIKDFIIMKYLSILSLLINLISRTK